MNIRAIEWRSVSGGAWHLFFGSKSICNRAYSNGKYDYADSPPDTTDVCGHCKRAIPTLRKRIAEVTVSIK